MVMTVKCALDFPIKMDAGDDTNCSTECTGISDIPNTNHTACSKLC